MVKKYILFVMLCAAGQPATVAAQDFWLGGRAAGGLLSSRDVPTKDAYAFSALAGYDLGRANATVSLDYLSIRTSPDGSGRYYVDTFSNGGSACRDRITGQFARSELCSSKNKTSFAPSAYVSYRISSDSSVAIGLGARTGSSSGPILLIYKHIADGFVGGELSPRGAMVFVSFVIKQK